MTDSEPNMHGAPPAAIRMDFARRLQNALNDKGWTQSELARRVAPLMKESRVGRDNISKYLRAKVLPLPAMLEAMAKALGVESRDLLPARGTQAVSDENAPYDMRALEGGERVWLRINQALDMDIALEIMALIRKQKERGRG
jgi:transcriptional regulator with XRE-family HTH domain